MPDRGGLVPCFEELAKKHAGDFEVFQISEVGFNQQMYILEIVEGVVAGVQPGMESMCSPRDIKAESVETICRFQETPAAQTIASGPESTALANLGQRSMEHRG